MVVLIGESVALACLIERWPNPQARSPIWDGEASISSGFYPEFLYITKLSTIASNDQNIAKKCSKILPNMLISLLNYIFILWQRYVTTHDWLYLLYQTYKYIRIININGCKSESQISIFKYSLSMVMEIGLGKIPVICWCVHSFKKNFHFHQKKYCWKSSF